MVSSGLVAHICVAAMLIFPKRKSYKESSNDKTKQVRKSWLEQSGKIFRNSKFILLSITAFFHNFSACVVYTHIAAYAKSEGLALELESLLISVVGFCTIGKLHE